MHNQGSKTRLCTLSTEPCHNWGSKASYAHFQQDPLWLNTILFNHKIIHYQVCCIQSKILQIRQRLSIVRKRCQSVVEACKSLWAKYCTLHLGPLKGALKAMRSATCGAVGAQHWQSYRDSSAALLWQLWWQKRPWPVLWFLEQNLTIL